MDSQDDSSTKHGEAEVPHDAASGEPEGGERTAIPLGALGTEEVLVSFLGLLAAKAWEGMGLVPVMGTGKTEQNFDGARLAIDAYAVVFELVRGRLQEAPRREMETLLTNLRVNFVDKSAKKAE